MTTNFIAYVSKNEILFKAVDGWIFPLVEGKHDMDGEGCRTIHGKRCQTMFLATHKTICFDVEFDLFGLGLSHTGNLCVTEFEATKRSMTMIARKELNVMKFQNKASKANGELLKSLFKEFRVVGGRIDITNHKDLFTYSRSRTKAAELENTKVIEKLLAAM